MEGIRVGGAGLNLAKAVIKLISLLEDARIPTDRESQRNAGTEEDSQLASFSLKRS